MKRNLLCAGLLLCSALAAAGPVDFDKAFEACTEIEKQIERPTFADRSYLITDFGARPGTPDAPCHEAINRAISGITPMDSAVAMAGNQQYTLEELDRFGVFVIMHVHNMNVCDENKLLDDYNDYVIERNMDYSQAFDYIIRRYIDDCRALENNPKSKWYGVEGGKPVRIVLCTYWHDARVVYNESVRRLAERWKEYACLCEFDENIGFSKDDPDSDTGEQISLIYAQNGINDTEIIDGVTYGWHPTRGEDAEIQLRMAKIFADTLKDNYGL